MVEGALDPSYRPYQSPVRRFRQTFCNQASARRRAKLVAVTRQIVKRIRPSSAIRGGGLFSRCASVSIHKRRRLKPGKVRGEENRATHFLYRRLLNFTGEFRTRRTTSKENEVAHASECGHARMAPLSTKHYYDWPDAGNRNLAMLAITGNWASSANGAKGGCVRHLTIERIQRPSFYAHY